MTSLFVKYKSATIDTLCLMALQGLNYLLPLCVWPYLMVVLGVEQFGVIGFASALMQFLIIVVDYGFNITATKAITLAQSKADRTKIFYATMAAKLVLLSMVAIIVYVVCSLPKFAIYRSACYIMFGMVIGNVFTMQWLYQGLKKIRVVTIVHAICRLLILPLTFVVVKQPDHILLAATILSVAYLAPAIVMIVITLHKRLVHRPVLSFGLVKTAFQEGFPVFVANGFSSVYAMLFVVFLGYFTAPDEVGKYAAVEKIIRGLCYLVLLPTIQAFYPYITKVAASSKQEALGVFCGIRNRVGVIMVLLGGVLFVTANIWPYLLGPEYEGTATLFRIMSFIPLFVSLGGIQGQLGLLAIGHDKEKKCFRNVYIVAGILAVCGILAISPILTASNAAWVLFATEFLVAVGMVYYCRKL